MSVFSARWRWALVAASLGWGAPAPPAAAAPPVSGSCAVQFFATSTLHDFEGSGPCQLAIDPPDASGRYAARAEVAVAAMTTDIAARDRKMRQMFEAKQFPLISATFRAIDPAALRALAPDALGFRLTIHGVEREVVPSLSDFSETPDQRARFRATFELSLRDFGMQGPVAMGFIRVNDAVRVVVDVQLVANSPTAPQAPSASP